MLLGCEVVRPQRQHGLRSQQQLPVPTLPLTGGVRMEEEPTEFVGRKEDGVAVRYLFVSRTGAGGLGPLTRLPSGAQDIIKGEMTRGFEMLRRGPLSDYHGLGSW